MDTIPPKIIAAISTAVKAYREEQEGLEEKKSDIPVFTYTERVNLWAIAGRQDLMLQRRLWQQRLH